MIRTPSTMLRLMAVCPAFLVSTGAVAQPGGEPVTWESVPETLERAEAEGFSGAVLLVRDGEIALNKGYGMADRERGIPNTPETIFALGSTPIDFTHVAVLQLLDAGKLDLDDPVDKYFGGFLDDKAAMTLEHLRTGASGLPDFPYIPGVDEDPDHSPLTREQLIDRAREAELLFDPGTNHVHSHFAWGVLAAVVEEVSGQTYRDYVVEHVLKPAGMARTGFHGQSFPGATVAMGYGPRSWGEINSPEHWGETSWLVMGSGGMVGTTGDLFRFNRAVESGKLIPERVRHLYPTSGVYANGNMYGFETYYNLGGDDLFFLNCNNADVTGAGVGFDPRTLARQLESLCEEPMPANFSIGVALRPSPEGVVVGEVMPGSPAQRAGLEPGDTLVSCNGERFDPGDPLEALRPGIEHGRTLRLRVNRAGETLTLTLRPAPRADGP